MIWGMSLVLLEELGHSPIPLLASYVGASVPAIKLLVSVCFGYPIGVVFDKLIADRSVECKKWFLIASGLDIIVFNIGLEAYHSVLAVSVFCLTTAILNPGPVCVSITFAYNFAHLIIGYWFYESDGYDINWTMPHCVLVLKLIGLSFDLWDGTKCDEDLSVTNRITVLRRIPSCVDIFAFSFFPATNLVGPQFSMIRFYDFIENKHKYKEKLPMHSSAAMKRYLTGYGFLALFQLGSSMFPSSYMLSEEFQQSSIISKHIFIGMWAKFALFKYFSLWLLAEGSCMRFGLTYNGMANDKAKWDGCCNIKVIRFESATTFGHCIEGFNVNTNNWVAQYVYKRLAFLGNRYISQFVSLLFLAVWHGLHSGYYMTFFNEFMIMYLEKDIKPMLERSNTYQRMWRIKYVNYFTFTLLKSYTTVFMGWSIIPFEFKSFDKWWQIYSSLYFSGFIVFLPWAFVYKPIVKMTLRALDGEPIKKPVEGTQ